MNLGSIKLVGLSRKFEFVCHSNLLLNYSSANGNIVNGDWTLLSGQHYRASMVLLSKKTRKRIDSYAEGRVSSRREKGEIVCHVLVFAIFRTDEGASGRSPNPPTIRDERANRVLAASTR